MTKTIKKSDHLALDNACMKLKRLEGLKDKAFIDAINIILRTRIEAIGRYGLESHYDKEFGLKELFLNMARKYRRMKRYFWDGKELGSESLEDTLADSAVYSTLLLREILLLQHNGTNLTRCPRPKVQG